MLPHLTATGIVKRSGMDDAYHGRPRNPPFQSPPLLDAYMTGYKSGQNQRHLEVQDGTHATLFNHKGDSRDRNRRTA